MGYGDHAVNSYWYELNEHMDQVPNKYIKIRMADNNGKIKQNIENKLYVGRWAYSNRTEKGNGDKYNETRKSNDLTRANTFLAPGNRERGKLADCRSRCVGRSTQIDYIAISRKAEIKSLTSQIINQQI